MYVKRVRFQSPSNMSSTDTAECHSPRPCVVKKLNSSEIDLCYQYPASQTPNSKMDAVEYFNTSNSIPYSGVQKHNLECNFVEKLKALPSNELELSMLDVNDNSNTKDFLQSDKKQTNALDSVFPFPNRDHYPKVSKYDDDFFLKPKTTPCAPKYDGLSKSSQILFNNNVTAFACNRVDVEKKFQPLNTATINYQPTQTCVCCISFENKENIEHLQNCCKRGAQTCKNNFIWQNNTTHNNRVECLNNREKTMQYHCCKLNSREDCNCNLDKKQDSITHVHCECNNCKCALHLQYLAPSVNDGVYQKRKIIEELEKNKTPSKCISLDNSKTVAKPKREATITDLFKIIKLQNEQLQLLQDKVEKLITVKNTPLLMNQNFIQEHVAVETVDQNHQKMSIGVMTSFEVVRTSTYINKGISKNQNAQIQCNRSELSIKEVVTKSQTVNENFLEGITPCKPVENESIIVATANQESVLKAHVLNSEKNLERNDDKILNELSLCNLHIDNATTPQLSPDQTLYLDVRDYSDSESEDQSNIGWTYYNKVMTHVNCMLDNSEMPSSASAMYRKANRQVQMQIDKNNLSVMKKVKFGDDPLGVITQQHLYQPQIYQPMVPATETSLKMNALAAKYLKTPLSHPVCAQPILKTTPIIDLSFATRNYMERHQLLPGIPSTSKKPQNDMPRFLDVTALKQQPKLL